MDWWTKRKATASEQDREAARTPEQQMERGIKERFVEKATLRSAGGTPASQAPPRAVVVPSSGIATAALARPRRWCTVPALDADSQSIDVKMRSFIPSPAVAVDMVHMPIAEEMGFAGDGRDFSYDTGTSRGEIWADAIYGTTGNHLRIKRRAFGESRAYDRKKLVDVGGKPAWWKTVKKDPFLNMEERADAVGTAEVTNESLFATADMEQQAFGGFPPVLHLHFLLKARVPVATVFGADSPFGRCLPYAPASHGEFDVFLMSGPNATTLFCVTGWHESFPAYELYIERKLVYSYDPVKAGKSPTTGLAGVDGGVEVIVGSP